MADMPGGDNGRDHEQHVLLDEAARLGDLARELRDSASSLISKTWADEQAIRQRALALESDMRRLQSMAKSGGASADPKNAEKIEEELYRARGLISESDVALLLPSKAHGSFLKMFLGPISVRATRKEVQLKVKQEYNSYRVIERPFYFFFFHPFYFFRGPGSGMDAFQPCRFSCTRWMYHHYCAMLMALVSLTWEIKGQPDCSYKQRGAAVFGMGHNARQREWMLCGVKLLVWKVNCGCYAPSFSFYRVSKRMLDCYYFALQWLVLFLSGR